MSYATGTSAYLYAQLSTALAAGSGCTVAWYSYHNSWAAAYEYIVAVHDTQTGTTNAILERSDSAVNGKYSLLLNGSSSKAGSYTGSTDYGVGAWLATVGTYTGTAGSITLRKGAYGNSNSDNPATLGGDLSWVTVGRFPAGSNGWNGYVAEVAIWNSVLSAGDQQSYFAGTSADQISASTLRAYWPLYTDATKFAGLDSVGSMTISGATQNALHPTITHAPAGGTATMGRCIYILP